MIIVSFSVYEWVAALEFQPIWVVHIIGNHFERVNHRSAVELNTIAFMVSGNPCGRRMFFADQREKAEKIRGGPT
jgi:hypothetical protein